MEKARDGLANNIADSCGTLLVKILLANAEGYFPPAILELGRERCAFRRFHAGHDTHGIHPVFRISCDCLQNVLRLLWTIVFNLRVPGLARGSIPGATLAALLTAQTVGPSQGDARFVDRLIDTRHGLGIVRNRPIPSDPELIRPPNPVE